MEKIFANVVYVTPIDYIAEINYCLDICQAMKIAVSLYLRALF
jgi:hypothetical protein